jgi:hypothetical protein
LFSASDLVGSSSENNPGILPSVARIDAIVGTYALLTFCLSPLIIISIGTSCVS